MDKNALLSVYHKDGIVEFAQELTTLGYRIFSSGGTAKTLQEAGVSVTDVADLSGLPAILGHRVVTLVPQIHGGLLAMEEQIDELNRLGYPWIDLVCVDFYPLKEEARRQDATRESVIEKTDIGGPTMVRSGAKGRRIVVVDPADRMRVIEWLKNNKPDEAEFRNDLAAKAEAIIADYCLESARFHSNGAYEGIIGSRVATCKYGENAWQTPAHLYTTDSGDPLALDKFEVIEGAPPSYNNWVDIDRLLQTITHIAEGYSANQVPKIDIAVGVKHGNPCGAAAGINQVRVLEKMMAGDPLAIFGGLVMTNFTVDEVLGEVFAGKMLDGIIAPAFTPGAVEALQRKNGKCRLVVNPALERLTGILIGRGGCLDQAPRFRFVRGGFLVQPNYFFVPDFNQSQITRYRRATIYQEYDMILAWAIGSTSNSNTITIVKDGQLIGNGVGQQDRVGAVNLAITRAHRSGHDTAGAVAYSDSFFPFPDGPQALVDAGISAIFTSSGSVKDQEVIDLCTAAGVALYMVPDQIGRGFFGH
jgi:phosphoribosylaminoimidazolecarboxamide formyltransferase/IMP cyclohydrolase